MTDSKQQQQQQQQHSSSLSSPSNMNMDMNMNMDLNRDRDRTLSMSIIQEEANLNYGIATSTIASSSDGSNGGEEARAEYLVGTAPEATEATGAATESTEGASGCEDYLLQMARVAHESTSKDWTILCQQDFLTSVHSSINTHNNNVNNINNNIINNNNNNIASNNKSNNSGGDAAFSSSPNINIYTSPSSEGIELKIPSPCSSSNSTAPPASPSSSPSSSSPIIDALSTRITALFYIRIIAILYTRQRINPYSNCIPTVPTINNNQSHNQDPNNPNNPTNQSSPPSSSSSPSLSENLLFPNIYFSDLSTSTISYTILQHHRDYLNNPTSPLPTTTTTNTTTATSTSSTTHNQHPYTLLQTFTNTKSFQTISSQLHSYVHKILSMYRNVPYHNARHAFNVVLSANKLLDLILCEVNYHEPLMDIHIHPPSKHHLATTNTNPTNAANPTNQYQKLTPQKTYGIKSDPLLHLSYLYSALIHDVDHTGINNRQLVAELDPLAILYNDQSVAEQHSLAVAFKELMGCGYALLRDCLFGVLDNVDNDGTHTTGTTGSSFTSGGSGASSNTDTTATNTNTTNTTNTNTPDTTTTNTPQKRNTPKKRNSILPTTHQTEFRRFRSTVIDLVLSTDIASPERIQIIKSKWKEAFGVGSDGMKHGSKKKSGKKKKVNSESEDTTNQNSNEGGDTTTSNNNKEEEEEDADLSESESEASSYSISADSTTSSSSYRTAESYPMESFEESNHFESTFQASFQTCTSMTEEGDEEGKQLQLRPEPSSQSASLEEQHDDGDNVNLVATNSREFAQIPHYQNETTTLKKNFFDMRRTIAIGGGGIRKFSIDDNNDEDDVLRKSDVGSIGSQRSLLEKLDCEDLQELSEQSYSQTDGVVVSGPTHIRCSDNEIRSTSRVSFRSKQQKSTSEPCRRDSLTKEPSLTIDKLVQQDTKPSKQFRPTRPAYFGHDESMPLLDFTQSQPITSTQHFSTVSQPLPLVTQVTSATKTTTTTTTNDTNADKTTKTTNIGTDTTTPKRRISSAPASSPAPASASAPSSASAPERGRREGMSRRNSAPMISQQLQQATSSSTHHHRKRLGIRMSMDLSGAAIQPYKNGIWVRSRRSASMNEEYGRGVENLGSGGGDRRRNNDTVGVEHQGSMKVRSPSVDGDGRGNIDDKRQEQQEQQEKDEDMDVPNELKAIVVLETLMKAADISTLMMDWDVMVKWSANLYYELEKSYNMGRGEDPLPGWFDNQCNFLQLYILPITRHLSEMQVFQEEDAKVFFETVEKNKLRWIVEGKEVTSLIAAGQI